MEDLNNVPIRKPQRFNESGYAWHLVIWKVEFKIFMLKRKLLIFAEDLEKVVR